MRLAVALALMLFTAPAFAHPGLPLIDADLSAKVMMSDHPRYPVRTDIVGGLDLGNFYVDDILHWDRAGVTREGASEFPLTVLNNKLTVGYDVWKGLGPVVQRSDVTDRDPVHRVGVAWDGATGVVGFKLGAKTRFMFTNDPETMLRFDQNFTLRHVTGLWAYNNFTIDFAGGHHQTNNKFYVGYEVHKNTSILLHRNDITDRPTVYRVGLQVKFW